MNILISKVETKQTKQGKTYKAVTGLNTYTNKEVTKNVFDIFEKEWPLLIEGGIVQFKHIQDESDKWILDEIIPASLPDNPPEAVQSTTQPPKEESNGNVPTTPVAPQERGMWWKELGESLRYGLIDHSKPHGRALKYAYFNEMYRVLNLDPKAEIEAK